VYACTLGSSRWSCRGSFDTLVMRGVAVHLCTVRRAIQSKLLFKYFPHVAVVLDEPFVFP